MMRHRTSLSRPSARNVLVSGSVASVAYLLAQSIDRWITNNAYDDLLLWGGFVSRDRRRQQLIGAVAHFSIGTGIAALFAVVRPSLPRLPDWLLGMVFIQVENTILFPAVAVIDRIHPSVQRHELPRLFTWQYFWLEAVRHLAFGGVLGWITARLAQTGEQRHSGETRA